MSGPASRDFYHILGVSRRATQAEIRAAFLRLAHLYHPDLHADVTDRSFKRIRRAYEVLIDPRSRERYDHSPGSFPLDDIRGDTSETIVTPGYASRSAAESSKPASGRPPGKSWPYWQHDRRWRRERRLIIAGVSLATIVLMLLSVMYERDRRRAWELQRQEITRSFADPDRQQERLSQLLARSPYLKELKQRRLQQNAADRETHQGAGTATEDDAAKGRSARDTGSEERRNRSDAERPRVAAEDDDPVVDPLFSGGDPVLATGQLLPAATWLGLEPATGTVPAPHLDHLTGIDSPWLMPDLATSETHELTNIPLLPAGDTAGMDPGAYSVGPYQDSYRSAAGLFDSAWQSVDSYPHAQLDPLPSRALAHEQRTGAGLMAEPPSVSSWSTQVSLPTTWGVSLPPANAYRGGISAARAASTIANSASSLSAASSTTADYPRFTTALPGTIARSTVSGAGGATAGYRVPSAIRENLTSRALVSSTRSISSYMSSAPFTAYRSSTGVLGAAEQPRVFYGAGLPGYAVPGQGVGQSFRAAGLNAGSFLPQSVSGIGASTAMTDQASARWQPYATAGAPIEQPTGGVPATAPRAYGVTATPWGGGIYP